MPIGFALYDAANPAKLAEFWALALSYELEKPPPGFVSWEEFAERIGLPARAVGLDGGGRRPGEDGAAAAVPAGARAQAACNSNRVMRH
jgi:hypothetical protein